jgi:hypothetical protein
VHDVRELHATELRAQRHEPRRCERCGASTNGGKPVCPKHLLELPLARDVRAGLAAFEADSARPRVDGPWAAEVLRVLEVDGPRTAEALAKWACAAQVEVVQVERLCRALARERRVRLHTNKRGSMVVELR